jgi:IS4 transposase
LCQELPDLPCSLLCRVKDNAASEVQEERALSPAAVHVGVVREAVLRRVGPPHQTCLLPQPFRLVQVATGQTRKDGTPDVLVLVTNRLDLDAELLAVASRSRWAVELFVRWVKWVLGCRHLLSQGINGVRLQGYAAFMASLLISLWVGRAPTKRT